VVDQASATKCIGDRAAHEPADRGGHRAVGTRAGTSSYAGDDGDANADADEDGIARDDHHLDRVGAWRIEALAGRHAYLTTVTVWAPAIGAVSAVASIPVLTDTTAGSSSTASTWALTTSGDHVDGPHAEGVPGGDGGDGGGGEHAQGREGIEVGLDAGPGRRVSDPAGESVTRRW